MKDDTTNANSGEAAAIPTPPASAEATVPEGKLPPELLEWALQQINEEEIIAGLEEIKKTGGLQFDDFFPELEQAVTKICI